MAPLRVCGLIFENFELLDYFGPVESFAIVNALVQMRDAQSLSTEEDKMKFLKSSPAQIQFDEVAPRLRPVEVTTVTCNDVHKTVSTGVPVTVQADATIEEAKGTDFDLIIIPGGLGCRIMTDEHFERFRDFVLTQHARGCIVASVCTATLLLARCDLLRHRRATTNKGHFQMIKDLIEQHCDGTAYGTMDEEARYVIDTSVAETAPVATCGGVSAGIDLSLALLDRVYCAGTGDLVALHLEHTRNAELECPFAAPFGLTD